MKTKVLLVFIFSVTLSGILFYLRLNKRPELETKFVQNVRDTDLEKDSDLVENDENTEKGTFSFSDDDVKTPGISESLENNYHTYQTFNNCGPATLSMALAWNGIKVSQEELAQKMRPYQNPRGDNDDKTIFTYEFVNWAKEYGLEAVGRVNGDIEIIKKFITNGFPVVVKTWLKKNEDIGHFRFVTGYDESKNLIYYDDSYDGPNKKMLYFDFLSLWQPFNYSYIVLYSKDKEDLIKAIIGEDWDEQKAWENALERAKREHEKDLDNIYPLFNISTSSYHLGQYQESINAFEKIESKLPRRMLWYQIEPIKSYYEIGNYDKVFEITDYILENGNRAFSELYLIRSQIYYDQGFDDDAKVELELAKKYNVNLNTDLLNLNR